MKISLENIRLTFGSNIVLEDLSLNFKSG
ncbi:hypothetical protein LCGC14_2553690, partial [marine sediment metagenome]